MKPKRKPPKDNVRRVVFSGKNIRSTYVNVANRTVQCESHLEKILCMTLDRDRTVSDYISQPEVISWIDEDGKRHTYVPDYKVMRNDGSIELHEVTLTARQADTRIIARQKAAQEECKKRDWKYVIHTELSLPRATELANLEVLICYRASAYLNREVARYITQNLTIQTPKNLRAEVQAISQKLSLPSSQILTTFYYLIWHKVVAIRFDKLLLVEGIPASDTLVWLTGVPLNEQRH